MTNKIKESNITDSAVTTAKLADSAVTNAKITGNINFKNIIINGDMSIAQRGTSQASISSSAAYYTIDRYKTQVVNAGTWTQSQSTDVPSGQGFGYSLKMDCTTADASLGADDFLVVQQVVEGQNLQYLKYGTSDAESVTISFWVKSNKTGTYNIWLYSDNATNKSISSPYTINSADTWEKKTLTFVGDTAQTIINDNAGRLRVYFVLAGGSNWTSGTTPTAWEADTKANRAVGQVNLADNTSNEWFITGVQLEAGTTASDFEFLPHDVNLARCHRYCYVEKLQSGSSGYGSAFAGYNDANYIAFRLVPPVPFRVPPTSVTETGDVQVWRANTGYTGWTFGFILGQNTTSNVYFSANKASHGLGTNADYLIKYSDASHQLEFSAEL